MPAKLKARQTDRWTDDGLDPKMAFCFNGATITRGTTVIERGTAINFCCKGIYKYDKQS